MSLLQLTKTKATTALGIDASTNSIAFAIFDGETPVRAGQVYFTGATVFERLNDAKHKVRALVESGMLRADYVCIESAIMVRSPQVAIDLAYVFGVIIGELMEFNPEVHKVAPISWQSAHGVPNLTKAEKAEIKKKNPGKSESWLKNEQRRIRKERILSISRQYFDIDDGSHDVGDAVGIARWIVENKIR